MSNNLISLKQIIEDSVRKAFEEQVNQAIADIKTEAQSKLDSKIEQLKQQAKKQANSMALEFLQRMDTKGISLELKL